MNYVPVKSPNYDRIWETELKLIALMSALVEAGLENVVEIANIGYTESKKRYQLEGSKVQMSVYSKGQIIKVENL